MGGGAGEGKIMRMIVKNDSPIRVAAGRFYGETRDNAWLLGAAAAKACAPRRAGAPPPSRATGEARLGAVPRRPPVLIRIRIDGYRLRKPRIRARPMEKSPCPSPAMTV